jgi:hypothetical protein
MVGPSKEEVLMAEAGLLVSRGIEDIPIHRFQLRVGPHVYFLEVLELGSIVVLKSRAAVVAER